MAKKDSEASAAASIVLHSSIPLLRERFRQLQKAKKLREEREQTKAIAEVGRGSSKWFVHPDLIRPSRPLGRGSPSAFWPREDGDERRSIDGEISSGRGEGDVDTSLHL
ncbi:hypothetical protein KSP39_PZI019703 [Platanthera zijinensis]|uniref:Uncharacterized protein n=1 Tax=Platanthera zijinensis TaxID=2320716 RepID=A0AAP0B1S9_9ASPA